MKDAYETKASLRSGRRRIESVPDLTEAPEQPEDLLFDVSAELLMQQSKDHPKNPKF